MELSMSNVEQVKAYCARVKNEWGHSPWEVADEVLRLLSDSLTYSDEEVAEVIRRAECV